jgi:hypothetical protein
MHLQLAMSTDITVRRHKIMFLLEFIKILKIQNEIFAHRVSSKI